MNKKKIYFIGIGGIGMSSLARFYKSQNWAVYGSDGFDTIITKDLKKDGFKVKIGQSSANIPAGIDLFVYTQAVQPQNEEFVFAKSTGREVLSYPQALGRLTSRFRTVAICGAHGKSTTTAMVGKILIDAKIDPTIILGTKVDYLDGSNFRLGQSKVLLIESDEYGAAFLNYFPEVAVILNIDKEHLDFYGNFAKVKSTFLKFAENIKSGGVLILNQDDKTVVSLTPRFEKIARRRKFKIIKFALNKKNSPELKKNISLSGVHNLSNALGAIKVAEVLGVDFTESLKSLSKFNGVWRRMQFRGKFAGTDVYDDYAHHPSEISASLLGLRQKYPQAKIICVFQPHQAKRVQSLFKEFIKSLSNVDFGVILPIYMVAGRDLEKVKYDSPLLVKSLVKKHKNKKFIYLEDKNNLAGELKKYVSENKNCVIVMMGAGSIFEATSELVTG